MRRSRHNRSGFTAVELVVVLVVLAIIVTVTMLEVDRRRQALLREESAANLRALYIALRADIAPDGTEWMIYNNLPSLSNTPGQLVPNVTDKRMQALMKRQDHTLYISPAHPDLERLRAQALIDPPSAFTDDSYWYLGYACRNEKAGLAFVRAYKREVKRTGKPMDSYTRRLGLYEPGTGEKTEEIRPLYTVSSNGSDIPILIERPGLQRGGSNVLFLDGTVEFIPYPGPWPMTEKFIKALESLDELKEKK